MHYFRIKLGCRRRMTIGELPQHIHCRVDQSRRSVLQCDFVTSALAAAGGNLLGCLCCAGPVQRRLRPSPWLAHPAENSASWLPQAKIFWGLYAVLALCNDDFSFHPGCQPPQHIRSLGCRRRIFFGFCVLAYPTAVATSASILASDPGCHRRRNIGRCAVLAQPTAMTTSASILPGFRSASATSTAHPTALRSAVGTPRAKPSTCSSCRRLENAKA
jgi:hypothetical protein